MGVQEVFNAMREWVAKNPKMQDYVYFLKIREDNELPTSKKAAERLWNTSLAGSVAAILYLIILVVALVAYPRPMPKETLEENLPSGLMFIYGLIVLGPPVYFFIESIAFYGQGHGSDEDYKHTQEQASRIWAAVSLLLGFYWFHELH